MTKHSHRRWAFPVTCVLAVTTIVAAYSNAFESPFHFDDGQVVQSNLYIRSLKNVPRFFLDATTYTSLPTNQAYRPLVTTTLALDYWLGSGLNVRQFHLSQLTMLVLLGVTVFFVFHRLMNLAGEHWWNRWAALVAATLYSAHTTNTETLNLMHVRSELLATLGVAASFAVYLYAPRSRRSHLYLLPMIVGAFAKSPAVIFAPLFLVYLCLFEQRLSMPDLLSSRSWPSARAAIWKSLPALLAGAGAFMFTEAMNSPTFLGGGSRMEYLLTQPFMWLHYARLFFLPVGLSADSDWTLIPHWYDTRVVAGLSFIVLLLRILWSTSKSPSLRPVAFGIAWFGLALLPASSIFPLTEVTNDHRPSFAYVGLALAVVWGLSLRLEQWSKTAPRLRPLISVAAVALALGSVGGNAMGTYERNKVFLTDESLWRDVTEKSPANGRGLMNYGLTHMARGRYAEAKALFDRATFYTPNYPSLEINLGIVTDRLGQPAVAESHFVRALQLGPNDPAPHAFYARWLVEQGRSGEAIPHLQRAVALSPADVNARYQLLGAYAKAERTAETKALALETLALEPGDPVARQYANGDVVAARIGAAATEKAADLLNTSLGRYQTGDFQGAINAARQALDLQPGYPEAYNNIAASFAALHQWDEAIHAAQEALRLKPDFPLARNNLRWAEGEKRKEHP